MNFRSKRINLNFTVVENEEGDIDAFMLGVYTSRK
jgi:hypothetical protein